MKKRVVGCFLIVSLCSVVTFSQSTWNGSVNNDWQIAGNWTPNAVPTSIDNVIFDTGGSVNVTNIPTQAIANLLITNATAVLFTPGAANQTLTINNNTGDDVTIASGSSLTLVQVTNKINVTLAVGGTANISGSLTLQDSNFDIGNGTLILQNNATLARTVGQISLGASSTVEFGTAGVGDTGPQIVLPNSILVANPNPIGTLIVNRTNGAALGDQTIRVDNLTLTLGDLRTNSAGRIRLSNVAPNPVETLASKIIGYAETEINRATGFSSPFTFLGLRIFSPANEVLTLERRTGAAGGNTFSSSESIDVTWSIALLPANNKDMSFSWLDDFDNAPPLGVPSAASLFQLYRFDSGPGWTAVGSPLALASFGTPRVSGTATSVGTFTSSRPYTLADQTQTLPVELTSFFATANVQSIKLVWQTASEKNNDFFVVEKMKVDQTFEVIGKLNGAGTTVAKTNYSFVDEKPRFGDNYYRLKQTDNDGKYVYSPVISAFFDGKTGSSFVMFPNPSDGKQLNFDRANEDVLVSLQDFSGKEIFKSYLTTDDPSLNIEPLQLTPGIYFVRLISKAESSVRKLIVK